MIIRDLIQPVIGKLRQRTELASIIPYFIAQTLLDLTENTEFEELKTTGPLTNFIQDQEVYDKADNPFINASDVKLTFVNAWFVYFDTSGFVTSGQSTGKTIDKRDIVVVRPMSKVSGIPCFYTIQGNNIIVGNNPDNPYPTQMDYQRQHPFNIPFDYVLQSRNDSDLANKLAQSKVYLPQDWTEIVILATAEKICDDVGMNEIGMQYHQKLFGYKDKRGNESPGLITVRQTDQERNSQRNSRALRPYVRRYTG